jgi:amino acid transporter
MMKRFQIILAFTAIISFILALALDLTSFGQDTIIDWKDIEILKILVVIIILIVAGLLLALFFFRKKNYKNRVLLTIPICFILFAIVDISKTAINYYGLNEEYNYFTAKQDIRKGKIQLLETTGLTLPDPNTNVDWNKKQNAEKKVEKQFGYKTINLGCTWTNGIGIYNSVMENYLKKVNGKNWRANERQIFDSIMNH